MVNSKHEIPSLSMRNKNWLVTFGDLLTLLLTFFVMTIALGGENSVASTGEMPLSTENLSDEPQVKRDPKILRLSGTKIALLEVRMSVREIGLVESDFNTEADELKPEALKRLRLVLSSRKDSDSPVRLEFCGGSGGYATEVSWFKSIARALHVRGQLIDTGFSEAQLAMRPMGPHCSLLGEGKESDLVGRIKL